MTRHPSLRRLQLSAIALAAVIGAALVAPAMAAPTARLAQAGRNLCTDATLTRTGAFTRTTALAPGLYTAPTCSVRVDEGVTLTVPAGTTIEFGENTNMQVNGRLVIAGANAGDVTFRSAAEAKNRGDWQGIKIQSKGTASIRGLDIRHTGETGAAAVDSAGAVSIENSTFEEGDGLGIVVQRGGGVVRNSRIADQTKGGLDVKSPSGAQHDMTLEGVTFEDNRGPAVTSGAAVQWTLVNNAARDNAVNGIVQQGGNVDRPLVLRGGDLPYVMAGNIVYTQDLTVEPNTVVKFGTTTAGLRVGSGARLVAEGTAAAGIVFSSDADDTACIFAGQPSPRISCDTDNDQREPQPGAWQKIEIQDTAVGASLAYVAMRYGGPETLLIRTAGATLDHVRIERANGVALKLTNTNKTAAGDFLRVTNSHFADNVGSAIDLDSTPAITVALQTNTFADNAFAVRLAADVELINGGNTATGGGVKGYTFALGLLEAKSNHTWRAGDLPWIVPTSYTFNNAAKTLTIAPGAVVKMGQLGITRGQGSLTIERGNLVVGGTDLNQPVLITSVRDDACAANDTTAGCDTNGDGGGSQPQSGDWTWLHIDDRATSFRMQHAQVRYGGGSGARYGMIEIDHTNSVVSDSLISHSLVSGIAVNGVQPRIERNTLRANAKSAIRIIGADREIRVPIHDNVIYDNNGGAIEIDANVEVDLSGNSTAPPPGYTATNRQLNGIVISGSAQSSTTWRRSPDMPFIINSRVDVLDQAVLTIEPGVILKFTPLGSISTSRGTLIAQGQADAKIIFTSVADNTVGGISVDGSGAPGNRDWGGLEFTRPGSSRSGVLQHVEVRYAAGGNPLASVRVQQDKVAISHVTISDGFGAGIFIDDADGVSITESTLERIGGAAVQARTVTNLSAIVKNNTIRACGVAASADANAQMEIGENTLENNDINGLVIKGSIKTKRTWYADDMTYVADDVSIDQGGNLLVEPGTMVKSLTDKGLSLRIGALELIGSAERPIVFTSIRDDRCSATVLTGCDTDTSDQDKEPGDWRGIVVDAGANNSVTLDNVKLFYAGQGDAAFESSANNTTVRNSEIAYSNAAGLAMLNVRNMVVTGNLVHHNGAAGLTMSGVTAGQLANNVFTDNERPVVQSATGILTTKDNVSVGNVEDAMLYAVDQVSNAQVWASDLPRDVTRVVSLVTGSGGGNPDLKIDAGLLMRFAPSAGIKARAGRLEIGGAYFTSDLSNPGQPSWAGISFEGAARGNLRHSVVALAGSGSIGAIDIKSEGQGTPIQVAYNQLLRSNGTAVTINPEGNNAPRPSILGNLIASTKDGATGYAMRLNGDGDPLVQYNRISDFPNGIWLSKKLPKINFNNFAGVRLRAVENTTQSNCVDAQNNWWGDLTGPQDNRSDGTTDRCKLTNPGAKGTGVSEFVDWDPYLKAAPPPVPMLDLPRCGVTNDTTVTVAGHAGPGAQVVLYDADTKLDIPITADAGGHFSQDVTLSAGIHDLSVETIGTADNSENQPQSLRSPRMGYRVVRVDPTSDIDPSSIVFEYGGQVQPLRDATGCAVPCGGASSGRVTLPPGTPVVVQVEVRGSPSTVEFIQPGQPAVPFSPRASGWRTEPFQPAAGTFTIRINGQGGAFCQGFVYFGGLGRVFSDTGAPGDPIVNVGFEDPAVLSDTLRMGAFVRTDSKPNATGTWSAATSPGGKYVPNAEYVISFLHPIDLSSIPSPVLTFQHMYWLEPGDTITVEGRASSAASWTTLGRGPADPDGWKLDKGSINVWSGVILPLEAFERSSRFELRFILKANSDSRVAEGWYLDDITIRPGGSNNLRYDTGEPLVAGAQVTLLQRDPETGAFVPWNAAPTGQRNPQTTDSDGRFGFFSLPAGEYRVLVVRSGGSLAPFQSASFVILDGSFVIDVPLSGGPRIMLPYVARGHLTR